MFAVGYTWMLIIPSSKLGQRTYIDENALQPGQVCTIISTLLYGLLTPIGYNILVVG